MAYHEDYDHKMYKEEMEARYKKQMENDPMSGEYQKHPELLDAPPVGALPVVEPRKLGRKQRKRKQYPDAPQQSRGK